MKVFKTEAIRNVVLLGHSSSGKTTLAEAMAFLGGAVKTMGTVEAGSTISDFDKEEQTRKLSLATSILPIEWNEHKLNILDTPGYFDFVGEAESAASVADMAVITVSGKDGIQAGTIKAWELCEKYDLPRMIFITEMDHPEAKFGKVVGALRIQFGKSVGPLVEPILEDGKFVGYVNVVKGKGRRFLDPGNREECPIPEITMEEYLKSRNSLMEAVAETSDEYMERFFRDEEFTTEEIIDTLYSSVATGDMVPVYTGSGLTAHGIRNILSDIVNFTPSPKGKKCIGEMGEAGFEADYDETKAKSAYVFKSMVDPFIGKYSLIEVKSGILKPDDVLVNNRTHTEGKIGKLYILRGNKPIEVPELYAGDIGALAKLPDTCTGDTISQKGTPVVYPMPEFEKPYTYKRYVVLNKGDEDKVSSALNKITTEDITIQLVNDAANFQQLIYGMGDQQLEVVVSKLKNRYKVEIALEEPKVGFKETILKNSDVDSKYKKQTGGHGQYGHVKMRFSPSNDLETPYVFEEHVVGGSVPRNYFPAVEKGLQEAVLRGPLAGYPVVGVKAELYDGSYHPVDSSEAAFKMATGMAFKDGFLKANPVLLEPIMIIRVTVPDTFTGDVMGDLNRRRGRVLGMNPIHGGKQVIEAEVPEMELFGYCTILRSMTGGVGSYEMEFSRYEQAPKDVQDKEVAKCTKEE